MTRQRIGSIGVDAGLCWVGDPCYILHRENGPPAEIGKTWPEFCNIISENRHKTGKPYTEFINGVVVDTGYGDGSYPVYATFNDEGLIASITVEFIGDDTDNVYEDDIDED